jgi:hypothetical protein
MPPSLPSLSLVEEKATTVKDSGADRYENERLTDHLGCDEM